MHQSSSCNSGLASTNHCRAILDLYCGRSLNSCVRTNQICTASRSIAYKSTQRPPESIHHRHCEQDQRTTLDLEICLTASVSPDCTAVGVGGVGLASNGCDNKQAGRCAEAQDRSEAQGCTTEEAVASVSPRHDRGRSTSTGAAISNNCRNTGTSDRCHLTRRSIHQAGGAGRAIHCRCGATSWNVQP